jgi:hypothetical protein
MFRPKTNRYCRGFGPSAPLESSLFGAAYHAKTAVVPRRGIDS